MDLPEEKTSIPRTKAHEYVQLVLLDERVGDVICKRQDDDTYTVTPVPIAD